MLVTLWTCTLYAILGKAYDFDTESIHYVSYVLTSSEDLERFSTAFLPQ